MKPLLLFVLLFAVSLSLHAAPPASPEPALPAAPVTDAGFYVSVEGGGDFANGFGVLKGPPSLVVHQTALGSVQTFRQDASPAGKGWNIISGAKSGYNFQSTLVGAPFGLRLQPALEAETIYLGQADFVKTAYMLNGILRFRNTTGITPYVGAGFGTEYVSGLPTTNIGAPGSGIGLAVQGLGGVSYAITKNVSAFAEYHYLADLSLKLNQSCLLTGVTYSF